MKREAGDPVEAQVRSALEEAFRGERGTRPPVPEGREFYRAMRQHLHLLTSADLRAILPGVLIDLLDTHTNVRSDRQDVEFVARHLNVLSEYPESAYEDIERAMGKRSAQNARDDDAVLRKAKIEQYEDFNSEQARAILGWLEFARRWGDLEWHQDDVVAGIAYWRHRAFGTGID